MLLPKKAKFRKQQRGRLKGLAVTGSLLAFGSFGLKSLGPGFLTSRQIEAARRAISHFIKREGKVWVRVFPDQAITKKPNETRMGGGKGPVDHYAVKVRPGKIIFEMAGVSEEIARQALRLAGYKLPVSTRFVKSEER